MKELTLSGEELLLFEGLQKIAEKYNPLMQLRIAGGWVRDKLLGIECKDIDVVVDVGSGLEFAQFLSKEMQTKEPAIISTNPEKSKHLETARVTFPNSLSIDFAALRSETYADTRIPQAQKGTPETDAHRRDFTINCLFYNLKTKEIEDYVGGEKDLLERVLKTPIDSEKTFKDDPLRLLRGIRFAVRLDFEPRFYIKDPDFLKTLNEKVSAERITIELGKAFSHNPARTAILLQQYHLEDLICKNISKEHQKWVSFVNGIDFLFHNGHSSLEDALVLAEMINGGETLSHGCRLTKKEESFVNKILKTFYTDNSWLSKKPTRRVVYFLLKEFGTQEQVDRAATLVYCAKSIECAQARLEDLRTELYLFQNIPCPINGNDIMQHCGLDRYKEGKKIGELLRFCEFLHSDNPSLTKKDLLTSVSDIITCFKL